MNTTSLGLLDRLKDAKPDASEWRRLQDIYLPLIRSWLAGVPGLRDEADDLAQEIFVILLRELPSFERRRDGNQVAALSGDKFLEGLRQAHGRDATPAPAKSLAEVARRLQPTLSAPPIPPTIADLPSELADHRHYEVIRELGRGGMGVVYLARHRLSGRQEVLKVMNQELLASPKSKERFLREIQSAAKLDHANVVKMYTALECGPLMVLVMEYVEGEDLAKRVKDRGPLTVLSACYYAQQVALGLHHAFERKMVHRDIKPQNLILFREGRKHVVKVLDFGLAKVVSERREDLELTGSGQMLGTPTYMAPEQSLDAASADIRADIYSLGCTLYYLLSGSPPFKGKSHFEILQAHHSMEAELLNLVRPEVPEELTGVVRKMMAKDPAKRYQTPVEVAQALVPFVKPEAKGAEGHADARTGSVKATNPDQPSAAGTRAVGKRQRPESSVTGEKPPAGRDTMTESGATSTDPWQRIAGRKTQSPVGKPVLGNKWLIWVGVGTCVLLLGLLALWASGVFKVKTKQGTLVVEVNEPDAEVFVDGEKVTATWGKDGKTAEVGVKQGTRKVEVKKDGFVASGEEVEIQSGGRTLIRAHLEPGVAAAARQPGLSLRPLNRMAMVRVGPWRVEGDQLIQEDATTAYPDIFFGDYEWTDYDFSAQARRVAGNDLFAFHGRWFDGGGFKFQAGNRHAHLSSLDQGVWTVVRESRFGLQNDVLYKTVLKVRGNRYQVVINNQVITDYVDPVNVSGQGRVGLGTNMAACRFTKIEVRSRAGKLLWTGPPEIDPPKPAAGGQPAAVGLEPLEQTAPKPGAPEPASPSRSLLPGAVLVGVQQGDNGGSGLARIEITERAEDVFKGILIWEGFFAMRIFALTGTLRGSDVKYEVGNELVKQGNIRAAAANNLGFVGKLERGMLEGRISTHDEKYKGTLKLSLATVYTGTYEFVTGAAAKGALRIEITERQENHFKGTLTSDDGPTTWVITGTLRDGEVQWQWGDMASKDGGTGENLTNNCGFAGKCKDGIVQGRFSTLDNAQTGSLRAKLVGLRSATPKK